MKGVERNRGITLVEALTAAAILAVLLALIAPAVMMSRESMRRGQCANNLRQIGLGLHAYESVFIAFPNASGGMWAGGRSFLVALLPHMEQTSLFNSLNFRLGLDHFTDANATAFFTRLDVLVCPSDGMVRPNPISATNYAGNRGVGVQVHGYDGIFGVLDSVNVGDVTDGLSQTSAVVEWATGPAAPARRNSIRSVFITPVRLTQPHEFDQFAALCDHLDINQAGLHFPPKGVNWFYGEFGYSLYNHTLTPNRKSCVNQTAYQEGAWTAGSFHNSGANALFADGHAAFVRESISWPAWRALGSRNGKETVGVDGF